MRRLSGWLLAIIVLGLLYAPMVAVGVLSVRESRLGLSGGAATLKWYRGLWENEQVLSAAKTSLLVATASTAIATVLGTLLAVGMGRLRSRWGRGLVGGVVGMPVVVPDVVMAAALVVAFRGLSAATGWGIWSPGTATVVMGHVTLQVAFVAMVVSARLALIGRETGEAARDLYASGWYELTRVTLPQLWPGVVAGALLAFVLSIDDFVIAFFTGGVGSGTLPVYIYGSVKRGISPELHALSTVVTGVTLLVVGVGGGVMGRRR